MNYVLEQLAAGATAITSTRRLSRYLQEQCAAYRLGRGEQVWPTPTIHTWSEWLLLEWRGQAQCDPALGQKIVLEEQQEVQLWEGIIHRSLEQQTGASLLQTSATARMVKETWQLVQDWQVPLDCLDQTYIEDTQAFVDWVREFLEQNGRNDWLCACQVGSLLQKQVESSSWEPSGKFLLIGFDQWTPSQLALLSALRESGSDFEQIAQPRVNQRTEVLPCADRRSEFEAAARWAKDLLARGEQGPIGIIVDDLAHCRSDIEVMFDQTLHPLASIHYNQDRRRAFHISLGKPLADHPLISAALTLLKFMIGARPMNEVTHLLHTPFLSAGLTESSLRAMLDLELRQRGWERMSITGLLKFAERAPVPAKRLLGCLRRAAGAATEGGRSPAQWAEIFVEWLSLFGWPGERELNSTEHQTVQAWREMLARFARLTIVTPMLDCELAVARLVNLTQRKIFQPKSEPAPVQIMGVLEASGMTFSHLWISGASDDHWPASPLLNPFLPYEVQRRFNMPGATAPGELERAIGIAQRLRESAQHVVVSFAQRRDDQSLHLSPIFREFPAVKRHRAFVDLATYIQRRRPVLEEVDDVYGPACGRSLSSVGVSVFKDQAACPFRAFARHRLRAAALPNVDPGLSPAERGMLVHDSIAGFWREIKTAAALKTLSKEELERTLLRHTERATAQLAWRDRSSFYRSILHIERERLRSLLWEWLRMETEREAFEVRQVEQKVNTSFAGVDVSLRIDRIDQLSDGRRVIIDYKTGQKVSIQDWLGDRPDDPQLPLYLLCGSGEFGALAFAHLRRGRAGFKGLSESAGFAKGVEQCEDWRGMHVTWQRTLGELADQFKAGYARIDPKHDKACQLCDVTPLCRIFDIAREKRLYHG